MAGFQCFVAVWMICFAAVSTCECLVRAAGCDGLTVYQRREGGQEREEEERWKKEDDQFHYLSQREHRDD